MDDWVQLRIDMLLEQRERNREPVSPALARWQNSGVVPEPVNVSPGVFMRGNDAVPVRQKPKPKGNHKAVLDALKREQAYGPDQGITAQALCDSTGLTRQQIREVIKQSPYIASQGTIPGKHEGRGNPSVFWLKGGKASRRGVSVTKGGSR